MTKLLKNTQSATPDGNRSPAGQGASHDFKTVLEAAEYLRCSKSFLDKKRLDGSGPVYTKLGRRVLYHLPDLESWVTANKRRHTSEYA